MREKNKITMENVTRRRFVVQSSKLLAFMPFVGVIGCISDKDTTLSSEDSLKRLIYMIGPWSIDDNLIAEDFAKRFLRTPHADKYLQKSVQLIKSLSRQIPKGPMAVKEVDLNSMHKEEQELLVSLTQELYGFIEVRFYASKVPPWGHCQGDPMWHTRVPN